jgi:hypothetical protein
MTYEYEPLNAVDLDGDLATYDNYKRLEELAEKQTISPGTDIRYYFDGDYEPEAFKALPEQVVKLPLDQFVERAYAFLLPSAASLPNEELDDHAEWCRDLIVFMAKDFCTASKYEIGREMGLGMGNYEQVKSRVTAIQRRIKNRLDKEVKQGDLVFLLFLNDLRRSLYRV